MTQPIENTFLDHRDLFGVEWSQGITFHEVLDWEQTKFKPYEQLEDIESNTSLDGRFQRLEDSDGDDILHVPKESEQRVLHAAIGHRPARIQRYTFLPEDVSKTGKFPNLQAPSPGDNFGYIDGHDSPYEEPTDAQELVMPPGVRVAFDFHNPGNDDHFPVLNIKARVYTIRNLDPRDADDQNQIRRIASPGSPMPIYSVGTTRAKAEYTLSREWGIEAIDMEDARDLGGN